MPAKLHLPPSRETQMSAGKELTERLEEMAAWIEECSAGVYGSAEDDINVLRNAAKEIRDLKQTVLAFAAPHAVQHARDFGLPEGHLHPQHYDLLKRCGARMVAFTRHEAADVSRGGGDG